MGRQNIHSRPKKQKLQFVGCKKCSDQYELGKGDFYSIVKFMPNQGNATDHG